MLILWVEKTTAALLSVEDLSSGIIAQLWTYISHLGCKITELGYPMVRGFNLCGCSAMGAVCGVVLACRLAGAFPGLGLVAVQCPSSSGSRSAWCRV